MAFRGRNEETRSLHAPGYEERRNPGNEVGLLLTGSNCAANNEGYLYQVFFVIAKLLLCTISAGSMQSCQAVG